MKVNRKLLAGTAALAALAFGGGAYAATQDSTNSRQAFLNDVAKRLKVSPSDLTNALNGAFLDQLQAAVEAGKLTQAQADQLKQRIQQKGIPFGGPLLGPRFFGHPGFEGPGGPGPRFGGALGPAVASYLGLSAAQLRDQLAANRSLAQIAAAQHKSASGLKSAITSDVRARLDNAVRNKMLTSTQEQQILSRLQSGLDALINHAGFGPHRFRHIEPGERPGFLPGPPPGSAGPLPAPPGAPAY